MNRFMLALVVGLSFSLAAQAQTIYRITDAQGNVVFTDNPERGGEQVEALVKPHPCVEGGSHLLLPNNGIRTDVRSDRCGA